MRAYFSHDNKSERNDVDFFTQKSLSVLKVQVLSSFVMAGFESRLSPQEERDLNKFQKFFAFKVLCGSLQFSTYLLHIICLYDIILVLHYIFSSRKWDHHPLDVHVEDMNICFGLSILNKHGRNDKKA